MSNEIKLQHLNDRLAAAIIRKDKHAILSAYEEAKELDLEEVDSETAQAYDELVSEANDILYA